MKIKPLMKLLSLLAVASLFAVGCSKESPAPAPTAPKVEAAPAPAPVAEVPKAEPVKAKAAGTYTAQEAKDHVGETATVTGKVSSVSTSKKGDTFIAIGGQRPNAPFTAVCFQGAIPADDLKKFLGKNVAIKGLIKEYNGQVEIILETVDQIVAVTE